MRIVTKSVLKHVYQQRPATAHKGDYGRVLVIGGSETFTGAPVLAARAALAAGCDIACIAAPRRVADTAARIPDMITYPLNCRIVTTRHLHFLLSLTKGKDACLIGNGLGRDKKTLLVAKKFIMACKKPMVVDADALHALKNHRGNGKTIYTPHAGEFHSLTGTKPADSIEKRCRQVKNEATRLNGTILLKGHKDVISNGKKIYINSTGNPYMTKGGTGDVLAGICVSLLSQLTKQMNDNAAFTAACAAAYINGAAGDAVARRKKQSLLASDLIEEISKVIGDS